MLLGFHSLAQNRAKKGVNGDPYLHCLSGSKSRGFLCFVLTVPRSVATSVPFAFSVAQTDCFFPPYHSTNRNASAWVVHLQGARLRPPLG